MAHWLMKTEPEDYSWEQLLAEGEVVWSGVRNHQAAANLRAMEAGEEAFFYRSVQAPAVVGIMRISAAHFPDETDATAKFVAVRAKPVRALAAEVSLKAIKADPAFADFLLVRQSRLSVVPVSDAHWRAILAMAEPKG